MFSRTTKSLSQPSVPVAGTDGHSVPTAGADSTATQPSADRAAAAEHSKAASQPTVLHAAAAVSGAERTETRATAPSINNLLPKADSPFVMQAAPSVSASLSSSAALPRRVQHTTAPLLSSSHPATSLQRGVSTRLPKDINFGDVTPPPSSSVGGPPSSTARPAPGRTFALSQPNSTPAPAPLSSVTAATKPSKPVAADLDAAHPRAAARRPAPSALTATAVAPSKAQPVAASSRLAVVAAAPPQSQRGLPLPVALSATALPVPGLPAPVVRQQAQSTEVTAAQLAQLSLTTPSTAQPAGDVSGARVQQATAVSALVCAQDEVQPADVDGADTSSATPSSEQHSAAHKDGCPLLRDEEMSEEEKIELEVQQENRAQQLQAYVDALDAETNRQIAQRRGATNERYDAMVAEHEAKLSKLRGGRSLEQLTVELQQWQDHLQDQQILDLELQVEERVEEAIDGAMLERKCEHDCKAAIAVVEAERERQRVMLEDEEGEVDEALASEMRRETLALERLVAEYRRQVELKEQLQQEASLQRQAAGVLAASKQARAARFRRNGA